MYCRTCGNKVNDNAEICVKCGCKPLIGKEFCQICGAKTTAQQQVCTKCGSKLKSIMTTTQKKSKGTKIGLKIIGNTLIAISLIFFAFMVWNIAVYAINYGTYGAIGHGAGAFKSFVLGLLFFIFGRKIKKSSIRK